MTPYNQKFVINNTWDENVIQVTNMITPDTLLKCIFKLPVANLGKYSLKKPKQ